MRHLYDLTKNSLSRVLPSTDLKIDRVIPLFVSFKDEVEEVVMDEMFALIT
jgi:hypothetical protein